MRICCHALLGTGRIDVAAWFRGGLGRLTNDDLPLVCNRVYIGDLPSRYLHTHIYVHVRTCIYIYPGTWALDTVTAAGLHVALTVVEDQ